MKSKLDVHVSFLVENKKILIISRKFVVIFIWIMLAYCLEEEVLFSFFMNIKKSNRMLESNEVVVHAQQSGDHDKFIIGTRS